MNCRADRATNRQRKELARVIAVGCRMGLLDRLWQRRVATSVFDGDCFVAKIPKGTEILSSSGPRSSIDWRHSLADNYCNSHLDFALE